MLEARLRRRAFLLKKLGNITDAMLLEEAANALNLFYQTEDRYRARLKDAEDSMLDVVDALEV